MFLTLTIFSTLLIFVVQGEEKPTEEACLALDNPAIAYANRSAYVSIGGNSFCWRSTGGGDFNEASTGNQCQEFPDGQLIDLSTEEAQNEFKSLIDEHGSTAGWFFWIQGEQNGGNCPGFSGGANGGISQATCSSQMAFYCQYPGSEQPTEKECLALDNPAIAYANRSAYVSIGGNSFCWRSTGGGDFNEASTGSQCEEFDNGELIDLSTEEAQNKFKSLIDEHGATAGWFFWIQGEQNGGNCPGFSGGANGGVSQATCSSQMTFYCQYPGNGQPTGKETETEEAETEEATEAECLALDNPAIAYANRSAYVSIGGNSFCWRSTGGGDFNEASSGNQCEEFDNGQLIDLSTEEAQNKFKTLIDKHGATSGWFFWIQGEQNGDNCPGYRGGADGGISQTTCSSQMTFYCQYPAAENQ